MPTQMGSPAAETQKSDNASRLQSPFLDYQLTWVKVVCAIAVEGEILTKCNV